MTTRSEQKRAAVLAAAQAEFQEKGFALSSMDAIAARAAVSKRTVYNHFPSKEALFDAIAGEFWQQSRALMAQTYQADVAIDVQLLSIARQVRSFYRNEQVIERARLLLAELIRQPELAQQIMQQMAEDCGLQLFLQQAVNAGALVIEDVPLAESQFWALCKAVDFWPLVLRLPCGDDLDETALQSNVRMFVRAYQTA